MNTLRLEQGPGASLGQAWLRCGTVALCCLFVVACGEPEATDSEAMPSTSTAETGGASTGGEMSEVSTGVGASAGTGGSGEVGGTSTGDTGTPGDPSTDPGETSNGTGGTSGTSQTPGDTAGGPGGDCEMTDPGGRACESSAECRVSCFCDGEFVFAGGGCGEGVCEPAQNICGECEDAGEASFCAGS